MDYRPEELLICLLSRLIAGSRHVAVGAASPLPACAAFLAKRQDQPDLRITLLHSRRFNHFTDGGRELFDCAGQGRIDCFFLGGVQIDGAANINLVGTGDYPKTERRFPGSFGSAYMYFLVPRVILFREEHSPRVLVPKVDFISAPGSSPPNVYRKGGPSDLVTRRAHFVFDRERRRFCLQSLHPGETAESIAENTGFAYDLSPGLATTSRPSAGQLALIRGPIADDIAESYPGFAARLFGDAA